MATPPHPDVEALRSADETTSAAAWATAYPPLFEAGMRVACARLSGRRHAQDREDLVAKALAQMVRGLCEKNTESFNRISSWDDCLRMMRALVRNRTADFLREHYRNLEDAFETLPEPASPGEVLPFGPGLEDIFAEIDRLDPPMPELFRERFMTGLTIDEIAADRDINRNTLCSWFAKALATLRTRLQATAAAPQ